MSAITVKPDSSAVPDTLVTTAGDTIIVPAPGTRGRPPEEPGLGDPAFDPVGTPVNSIVKGAVKKGVWHGVNLNYSQKR